MFRGGKGGKRSFDRFENSRSSSSPKKDFSSRTDSKPQEKMKTGGIQKVEPPSTPVTSKSEPVSSPQIVKKMNEIKREEAPSSQESALNITTMIPKYVGKDGEKKFTGRCRLFVANLNNSTTEEHLRELFGQFGETSEIFVSKDKGFGFIRMDYRQNAEMAKNALDKKLFKGRHIQVRFATHASAIELHGLDMFASNEFIEQAMSQFGQVERAVIVCDDRGRSKGYAIVEFAWKKSAQKVLDRFKGEMFVLGRLPKPVYAKPLTQTNDEEGINSLDVEKINGFQLERSFQPRFISPSSFEYTFAKKWRDLYIEEEDRKARLDQELRDARFKLELEMEAALQQQEAEKMRHELRQRQDELKRLEDDLIKRQNMAIEIARQQIERRERDGVNRGFANRPNLPPRDNEIQNTPPPMVNNSNKPNDFNMQQDNNRNNDIHRLGLRPELLPQGPPLLGVLQGGLIPNLGPGHPLGDGLRLPMHMQGHHPRFLPPPPGLLGGPREMGHPHRGGERFDHKRPRRD